MFSLISKMSRARGTGGALRSAAAARSASRWHFLYFLPLPHQQGAFLPSFCLGHIVLPQNQCIEARPRLRQQSRRRFGMLATQKE
jgi:hypothetical protein